MSALKKYRERAGSRFRAPTRPMAARLMGHREQGAYRVAAGGSGFSPAPYFYWSMSGGISGGQVAPTLGTVPLVLAGTSPATIGAGTTPRGGKWLSFGRVTDGLSCRATGIDSSTTCFGAWFKQFLPVSSYHIFIDSGGSSSTGIQSGSLDTGPSPGIKFQGATLYGGTPVSPGVDGTVAHFVIIKYTSFAGSVFVSVDGAPFVDTGGPNMARPVGAITSFGNQLTGGTNGYNGLIGDITIWNTNLTDADAARAYTWIQTQPFA